jgi:hypothetical protein
MNSSPATAHRTVDLTFSTESLDAQEMPQPTPKEHNGLRGRYAHESSIEGAALPQGKLSGTQCRGCPGCPDYAKRVSGRCLATSGVRTKPKSTSRGFESRRGFNQPLHIFDATSNCSWRLQGRLTLASLLPQHLCVSCTEHLRPNSCPVPAT